MDRPNTPSRAPLYSEPPSYTEDHASTPDEANGSRIRLLTSMDEPSSRPYVPEHFVPRPLAVLLRPRRQDVSTLEHLSSLKEEEKADSSCQLRKAPAADSVNMVELLPTLLDGPSRRKPFRSTDPVKSLSPPSYTECQMSSSNNKSLQTSSHSIPRRSYQPSVRSSHSRAPSIVDSAPPLVPDTTYIPYSQSGRISPTRSWSPSRASVDYGRPPPANAQFEPADLNGSPRPGTPSSQYGGSPRRPLPPAPLFSGPRTSAHGSAFGDDATVHIPLSGDIADGDDVFAPDNFSEKDFKHSLRARESYMSSETLTEDVNLDEPKEFVQHIGPAPDGRQERRGARQAQMAKKEVRLINGELILECKIPTILYSFLPRRDEVEFTHMRYTAVTCDPDDFVSKGYKLRQNIGATARDTELFICVTMYNENEIDFTRTMHAVMKNISHFCSRSKSRTWGENGWQKIVVCIVSDGRQKIHPRTLDALAAMGVYQDGIAKNLVNQKEVQAHVYEYTTQVSLDSDLKFKGAEKGIVPCQMIFCLKEKNAKDRKSVV